MATTFRRDRSDGAFRYVNPATECGAAQVSAKCRSVATVLSVSGVLTTQNLPQVTEQIGRFILGDKPVILDVSGVHAGGAGAAALLEAIEVRAQVKGVELVLVAGFALGEALRSDRRRATVAASVAEALRYLVDEMGARREVLLPLLAKTA